MTSPKTPQIEVMNRDGALTEKRIIFNQRKTELRTAARDLFYHMDHHREFALQQTAAIMYVTRRMPRDREEIPHFVFEEYMSSCGQLLERMTDNRRDLKPISFPTNYRIHQYLHVITHNRLRRRKQRFVSLDDALIVVVDQSVASRPLSRTRDRNLAKYLEAFGNAGLTPDEQTVCIEWSLQPVSRERVNNTFESLKKKHPNGLPPALDTREKMEALLHSGLAKIRAEYRRRFGEDWDVSDLTD